MPKTIEQWREMAYWQNRRKNCWKSRFHLAVFAAAVFGLTSLWLAIALATRPEQQSQRMHVVSDPIEVAQTSPDIVLASVYLSGCSGTVISRGDESAHVLSCAHCFGNSPGSTIWAHHPSGQAVRATLVAIDHTHDLSLWTIPAAGVLAACPITEADPPNAEAIRDVVGYPQGRGPTWLRLRDVPRPERVTGDVGAWRWVFEVSDREGQILPGNSGSGVFVNGAVCGVVTHRDETAANRKMRCVPLRDVISFVRRYRRSDCGGTFCPAPPREKAPPAPGEAPPPDDESAAAPAPPPDQPAGAPRFTPRPNVPLRLPPRPQDLNSDRKMAAEIDRLRKALASLDEIKASLAAIQSRPESPAAPLPESLTAIPDRLAAIEKLLAGAKPGEPVDLHSLEGQLATTVRDEIGRIRDAQGPQIKTALRDAIREHGLGDIPGAIEQAASTAAGGVATQLKADLVAGIGAKLAPLAGAAVSPSWLAVGLPALAAGGPVTLLGGVGLFLFSRMLKRIPLPQPMPPRPPMPADPVATIPPAQPQLVPILQQTAPPPQQIATELRYSPIERDTFSEAYAWAKSRLGITQPQYAEAWFGQLDSLISQYISGKGTRRASISQ